MNILVLEKALNTLHVIVSLSVIVTVTLVIMILVNYVMCESNEIM